MASAALNQYQSSHLFFAIYNNTLKVIYRVAASGLTDRCSQHKQGSAVFGRRDDASHAVASNPCYIAPHITALPQCTLLCVYILQHMQLNARHDYMQLNARRDYMQPHARHDYMQHMQLNARHDYMQQQQAGRQLSQAFMSATACIT